MNEKLRVSLEVNETFVAVTGEGKLPNNTNKKEDLSNNNISNKNHNNFSVSPHTTEPLLAWSDNTMIVPLMSLFQQSIKFKIYRELLPIVDEIDEFHGELLAWASDEELFTKEIWSKPNR